tara:strand:- start:153 stop:533 length:381 start_codon:yes stop_codon:yes gene_type:complete
MQILDNLQYTENHEWILLESGVATIGITDYAQKELGDIVYVDVNTLGETLDIDSIFGSVEAVKTVSDLFMPISGKVIEFNNNLETNPELINQQPYLNGWIIKVKTDDVALNSKLLTSDQYKNHIGL